MDAFTRTIQENNMNWSEYINSLAPNQKDELLRGIIENEMQPGNDGDFFFLGSGHGPGFFWTHTGEPLVESEPEPAGSVQMNYGCSETMGDYSISVFFKEKHELDAYLDEVKTGEAV